MSAADNTFLRASDGSFTSITGTNRAGGIGDENRYAQLRSTLTELLGGDNALQMTPATTLDLDSYSGPARSALGLQAAISGRATVVNSDVGLLLRNTPNL